VSDDETQRELRAALESFANKQDPGGRALDDLDAIRAPDPDG
jgi:hypothetical protein